MANDPKIEIKVGIVEDNTQSFDKFAKKTEQQAKAHEQKMEQIQESANTKAVANETSTNAKLEAKQREHEQRLEQMQEKAWKSYALKQQIAQQKLIDSHEASNAKMVTNQKRWSEKMTSTLSGISNMMKGAAIAYSINFVGSVVSSTMDYVGALKDASNATGVAADKISKLSEAFKNSGLEGVADVEAMLTKLQSIYIRKGGDISKLTEKMRLDMLSNALSDPDKALQQGLIGDKELAKYRKLAEQGDVATMLANYKGIPQETIDTVEALGDSIDSLKLKIMSAFAAALAANGKNIEEVFNGIANAIVSTDWTQLGKDISNLSKSLTGATEGFFNMRKEITSTVALISPISALFTLITDLGVGVMTMAGTSIAKIAPQFRLLAESLKYHTVYLKEAGEYWKILPTKFGKVFELIGRLRGFFTVDAPGWIAQIIRSGSGLGKTLSVLRTMLTPLTEMFSWISKVLPLVAKYLIYLQAVISGFKALFQEGDIWKKLTRFFTDFADSMTFGIMRYMGAMKAVDEYLAGKQRYNPDEKLAAAAERGRLEEKLRTTMMSTYKTKTGGNTPPPDPNADDRTATEKLIDRIRLMQEVAEAAKEAKDEYDLLDKVLFASLAPFDNYEIKMGLILVDSNGEPISLDKYKANLASLKTTMDLIDVEKPVLNFDVTEMDVFMSKFGILQQDVKDFYDSLSEAFRYISEVVSAVFDYQAVKFQNKLLQLEREYELLQENYTLIREMHEYELSALQEAGLQGTVYYKNMMRQQKLQEDAKQREMVESQKKSKAIQAEAFESERKGKVVSAIMNGALAITNIWATSKSPILSIIYSAISTAATAVSVAAINSQANPYRYAQGGFVPGMTSGDSVSARLEPGEFVVNRQASLRNAELLQALNNNKQPEMSGTTININGDIIGTDSYVREVLIPAIHKAHRDGVTK